MNGETQQESGRVGRTRNSKAFLTKAGLIQEVSQLTHSTGNEARAIVEAILESMVLAIRSGDKVEIRGFGTDKRRFRANVYIDITSHRAFEEDEFVGRTLRIGTKTVIAVVDRDPRCKMITLDPETAEANPEVMRCVARAHDGKAGVYAAVLVEGTIRPGDEIALLN
jgi:uncharacterized protein YcbX